MKKLFIVWLAVLSTHVLVAQETLEARLAKVPNTEDPEAVVKYAISNQDMEMLKYGVDKAGSGIKKMKYSYNQMELNKGTTFLDFTPLMQAAANGKLEMVNYLIEQKVNLDATAKAPIYSTDDGIFSGRAKGITAIHLAIEHGHKDVVKALVDAGADIMTSYLEVEPITPGARGISSTPKQWAKVNNQTEIEEMLKASKKGAFKSMMANPMGKKKN